MATVACFSWSGQYQMGSLMGERPFKNCARNVLWYIDLFLLASPCMCLKIGQKFIISILYRLSNVKYIVGQRSPMFVPAER